MLTRTRLSIGTLCVAAAPFLSSLDASAAPVFFDDRQAFMEAVGALSGFEDFEAANINPGPSAIAPGAWDSNSDNAIFSPGDLAEGIDYDSFPGDLMAVDGSFSAASTGVAIGPADADDNFFIDFNLPVNAFGLDLFLLGEGEQIFTIDVRTFFDELALSVDVTLNPLGSFFGVVDDSEIFGEFSISAQAAGGGEVIDNIVFGISNPTAVPEPGTLGLLSAGLLGIAFVRRRRRS